MALKNNAWKACYSAASLSAGSSVDSLNGMAWVVKEIVAAF